jgi:hypothetical protein
MQQALKVAQKQAQRRDCSTSASQSGCGIDDRLLDSRCSGSDEEETQQPLAGRNPTPPPADEYCHSIVPYATYKKLNWRPFLSAFSPLFENSNEVLIVMSTILGQIDWDASSTTRILARIHGLGPSLQRKSVYPCDPRVASEDNPCRALGLTQRAPKPNYTW